MTGHIGGTQMRTFARDTGGAIAVMTALVLPVLIGVAAYAIDASLLLYRQERLQIAVDIGARAGAEMLLRGETDASASAFAAAVVVANSGAGTTAGPQVTVAVPAPGQVSVDATLAVPRLFSRLFGTDGTRVYAGSVAVLDPATDPEVCVHLDDPGANRALRLRPDSSLAMDGCTLAVASAHGRAVTLDRGAALWAACLDVAGGISGAGGITLATCSAPRTGVAVPLPADFAQLRDAPPGPTGACTTHETITTATGEIVPTVSNPSGLREIRFCDGFKVRHDTVGGPGLYVFDDDLEIADGVTLDLGPGAVIVLQGDAGIDIGTNGLLRVIPPASGVLDGVAVTAGRDRDRGQSLDLDIGRMDVPGLLAFPGEKITLDGRNLDAGCLRIMAGELELARDTRIVAACATRGGGGGGGGVTLAPAL